MLPYIHLLGFKLSTFMTVMVVGYGLGFVWCYKRGLAAGLDSRDVLDGCILGGITVLFGAKIGHVLFESGGHALPDGSISTGIMDLLRADPWHWARLEDPGYVWYGGVIALAPVAWWFTGSRGIDRGAAADAGAPAFAFGVGFGRLGCFLGGCCYGAPTSVPWGVVFPAGSQAGPHPVHPTQLYESAFGWLLLAWMLWRDGSRRFKGELLCVAAVAYSLERFITEFWRGDAERGVHAGLGTSQIISIPGFLVSLGVYLYLRRHGEPPAAPPAADGPTQPDEDPTPVAAE